MPGFLLMPRGRAGREALRRIHAVIRIIACGDFRRLRGRPAGRTIPRLFSSISPGFYDA